MAFNKLFSFISFQLIHNGAISKDSPGLKGSEWKSWSRGDRRLTNDRSWPQSEQRQRKWGFQKENKEGGRAETSGGGRWESKEEKEWMNETEAEKKKNVRHRKVHRWFHTKKRREVRRALKMDDYNWWQQNCTKLCRAKARKVLWKYNFWHLNTSTDKGVSGT